MNFFNTKKKINLSNVQPGSATDAQPSRSQEAEMKKPEEFVVKDKQKKGVKKQWLKKKGKNKRLIGEMNETNHGEESKKGMNFLQWKWKSQTEALSKNENVKDQNKKDNANEDKEKKITNTRKKNSEKVVTTKKDEKMETARVEDIETNFQKGNDKEVKEKKSLKELLNEVKKMKESKTLKDRKITKGTRHHKVGLVNNQEAKGEKTDGLVDANVNKERKSVDFSMFRAKGLQNTENRKGSGKSKMKKSINPNETKEVMKKEPEVEDSSNLKHTSKEKKMKLFHRKRNKTVVGPMKEDGSENERMGKLENGDMKSAKMSKRKRKRKRKNKLFDILGFQGRSGKVAPLKEEFSNVIMESSSNAD